MRYLVLTLQASRGSWIDLSLRIYVAKGGEHSPPMDELRSRFMLTLTKRANIGGNARFLSSRSI
jgi:hypothetical protein